MTLNMEPQSQSEITYNKVSRTGKNNSLYKLWLISWKHERKENVEVRRRDKQYVLVS